MNDQSDAEATPRPLQLIKNTDVADRTPYIPRRKSSALKGSGSIFQDVSTVMSLDPPQKLLHVWPKHYNSVRNSCAPQGGRNSPRASHAKLTSREEMYNASFAQSQRGLPSHDKSSVSSSESSSRRRLFSQIISSFTQNNNSTQAISTLAESLGVGHGPVPRLSASTAGGSSSRTTSTASTESTESTETSLVRIDQSRTHSVKRPNSPDPLPAPPLCLRQDEEGQLLVTDQRLPSTSSAPEEAPPPAFAIATLHSISDITKADMEKAASVWVAIDVECTIHYAEDPASSVRSKALGPPHTDPGFLSKLAIDLIPAGGCNILRVIGSETRDFLLPGETWSVVAQILADPPLRRKRPSKAFSLQSRPSSHALMDQLHTMLSSSSGPSPQDLVHINLTFEHVLLPSNIQCCTSDNLNLERVSTGRPASRHRQYLRHRSHRSSSPRKTPPASRDQDQDQSRDHQQRDEVASKLLDLLEVNLHNRSVGQISTSTIGQREAVEVLEEFFDEYEGSSGLDKRARELLRRLDAKVRPVSRAPVSPIRRRRNGFELSRENLQLADITNQWSAASRSGVRGGGGERDRMLRDASVSTPVPAPLFSPRKRAGAKDVQRQREGNGSPLNKGSSVKRDSGVEKRDSDGRADIGSPRFYEDEVDEASRIWRGMRDSSAGSVGYPQADDKECGEREDGEENGNRSVLGAPWL
ncbi:hypothetical protein GJ744_007272 [Endocarpon pusillum]|uniref:Uncharacterized protein n=1 Tax=Endocarpon pusillum TaxID=364733 RepID=A0A8H7AIZ0_9EURO|nr:hypothetical protein GJ744_007272 [Endocarpon pusillum]